MLNLRGGAIEMKSALVFSLGAVEGDGKEDLLVTESSLTCLRVSILVAMGIARAGVSWQGVALWPAVWAVLAIVSDAG